MIFKNSAAVAFGMNSDAFTEFFGAVAVVAFLATALWIIVTIGREAANKQKLGAAEGSSGSTRLLATERAAAAFEEEVRKIQEEYVEFYNEAISKSKSKLGELVAQSRCSFENMAGAYSRICHNPDGEHPENLRQRFAKVCERQWECLKSDLGYVGYEEIEPQIALVLNAQSFVEQYSSGSSSEEVSLTPSMNRMQEVIALQKSVPKERMGTFQMDAIEAVAPFKFYFEKSVREWVNDSVFRIVRKIRERGASGATIRDTDLKGRFVRLKHILDTVGKSCERLDSNLQNIGQEDAAFNQIIFAGVVLSMLSRAPEWFPDLGDVAQAEAEEAMAVSASEEGA